MLYSAEPRLVSMLFVDAIPVLSVVLTGRSSARAAEVGVRDPSCRSPFAANDGQC